LCLYYGSSYDQCLIVDKVCWGGTQYLGQIPNGCGCCVDSVKCGLYAPDNAEMKKIYDPFKIIQILNSEIDTNIIDKKIREGQSYSRPRAYIKVGSAISPPAFYPTDISKMLQAVLEAIKINV